jgi:hypothetical protein
MRVRLKAVVEAIKKGLASVGVTKIKIVVAFLQVGAACCTASPQMLHRATLRDSKSRVA